MRDHSEAAQEVLAAWRTTGLQLNRAAIPAPIHACHLKSEAVSER